MIPDKPREEELQRAYQPAVPLQATASNMYEEEQRPSMDRVKE